jgi:hypothetical protein
MGKKLKESMLQAARPALAGVMKWFDPSNKNHLMAADHLLKKGTWPANFPPEGFEAHAFDPLSVMSMLVQFYFEEHLTEEEREKTD